MKSNNPFVSQSGRAVLMLLLIVMVCGQLRVYGTDKLGTLKINALSPATSDTSAMMPVLPLVVRPPAAQPQVGLPTDTHLDKTPPRRTVGLDLVKNGWTYNCMECHKLLPARWQYDRPLNEHQNIKLEHGNNRFCLNCHHATNRNAFVDYDGSEIAQADVVLLCAKCHGTTYRDWKAGVHGRANGFWNTNLGNRTKLRCIQCHDPHGPKFKAMKPLPPLRYPARAVKGDGNVSSPQREGGQAALSRTTNPNRLLIGNPGVPAVSHAP